MVEAGSEKNRKPRFDLFAWIGYFVAIGSLSIQFFVWWGGQPDLEFSVSEMAFSSNARIRTIPERLAQIEARHGALTGFRISRLREASLTVNWSDPEEVERLGNALQREIKFYDARIETSLGKDHICYDNGTIIWRDCELFDAQNGSPLPCQEWLKSAPRSQIEPSAGAYPASGRDVLAENCEFFRIDTEPTANVYFPSGYVEIIRRNPSLQGAPPEIRERIIEIATQLYSPQSRAGTLGEREEIASELRQVRQDVVDFRRRINDQLVLTLTVQNRSRAPNYLLKDGLMRICRQEAECRSLELQVRRSERLEGSSVASVELASSPLKPSAVDFIHQAIRHRYPAVTVIRDVHGNMWRTTATPSQIIRAEGTRKELSAKAREVFLEEVF